MKKFLAMVLAAMLLLSVGAVAVAEEASSNKDVSQVTIKKIYNGSNGSPAETFTLTVVESKVVDGDATSAPNLGEIKGAVFKENDANSASKEKDITIELPSYEHVGVYEYALKETDNCTAGVTYRSETIKLVVTVINGSGDNLIRLVGVHTEEEGSTKSDSFENTYNSGSLTVKKDVKGSLGDRKHSFAFTVTFTAPAGEQVNSKVTYGESQEVTFENGSATVNFKLKHGESMVFNNLPYGLTYTVVEDGVTENANGVLMNGDYKVAYDDNSKGTIQSASVETTITNIKGDDHTPDTGITTDSLPYVMLLGFVLLAGAALLMKRRMAH